MRYRVSGFTTYRNLRPSKDLFSPVMIVMLMINDDDEDDDVDGKKKAKRQKTVIHL